MPGFQQVMHSFAFDQRACKDGSKMRRSFAGREPLDVYSSRQIEKPFLIKARDSERSRSAFR